MTKLSDLDANARDDFDWDLELAIDLTERSKHGHTRPVSVADLYRYAENPRYNRDGEIRRTILTNSKVNQNWTSILARKSGSKFDLAAAAAGPSEKVLLHDGRNGRRIEFTRSSSDPDLAILIIDLGDTKPPYPTRLSIWTDTNAFELDLPAPHLGICQIDLQYTGEISSAFHDASVKVEIW
ncbi:MAG: hypothetical protein AAFW60_08445 [Pseudomonadota bacterium]